MNVAVRASTICPSPPGANRTRRIGHGRNPATDRGRALARGRTRDGVDPAATAAPAPAYTATFTADASCLLTVKATWKNAPVARVYLLWYQDATWIATSDTESPVNSGTIKVYTAAGAALEVADTAPVTVGCAVP